MRERVRQKQEEGFFRFRVMKASAESWIRRTEYTEKC